MLSSWRADDFGVIEANKNAGTENKIDRESGRGAAGRSGDGLSVGGPVAA